MRLIRNGSGIPRCPVAAALSGLIGAATLVSQASGHALLLSRGAAVVFADRVEVTLEVAAEDFLHYYGISEDADGRFAVRALGDAAGRFGARLCDVLLVSNASGDALPCDAFVMRQDWADGGSVDLSELRRHQVSYTGAYRNLGPTEFLTFRLAPDSQPVEVPWQIVLAVRGADQNLGQVARITSRGNAETVELRLRDGRVTVEADAASGVGGGVCAPFDARGSARFKEIFAECEWERDGVSLRLSVPLPLLATWIDLPRREKARITDAEAAEVADPLHRLIQGAALLEVDGRTVAAEVRSARFVGIKSDAPGAVGGNEALSVFTSRVVAELWFPCGASPRPLTIRWRLLNNAVLSAWAAIRCHGACTEHLFSAYRPDFSWTCGTIRPAPSTD